MTEEVEGSTNATGFILNPGWMRDACVAVEEVEEQHMEEYHATERHSNNLDAEQDILGSTLQ